MRWFVCRFGDSLWFLIALALFAVPAVPQGLQPRAVEMRVPQAVAPAGGSGGFTQRVWHTQDGLPDQIVQALAQTPDGYLWIGTAKALLRFDGRRFLIFSGQNTPLLREHGVYALLVARDGTLWIGTEGGGLLRYREGTFQQFSTADGLVTPIVRALYEDADGSIWTGTDLGLFRLVNGHFLRVESQERFPNLGVHSILRDRTGAVWVGGSKLVRFAPQFESGSADLEHFEVFPLEGQHGSMRIKALCETADGSLWVGTLDGLYRRQPGKEFVRVPGVDESIRTLSVGDTGRLWIGTIGKGLLLEEDHGFRAITAPNGLPSNTVLSALTGRTGETWIGTQAGLVRLSRTALQLTALPDAAESDFGTMMRDRDGSIWICATELFHLVHGEVRRVRFPGLTVQIRTMFRESSGALWLGTAGSGAYRIDGKGEITHYTSQLGTNYVRGFAEPEDGKIWIATDGGVALYRNGVITTFRDAPGASGTMVFATAETQDGLWTGTLRGLELLQNGRYVPTDLTRTFADQAVWALHADKDGALWIGSDSGLYRWKHSSLYHFDLFSGTHTPSIYGILEDSSRVATGKSGAAQTLWLSGPTEVLKVDRQKLDQVAEGASEDNLPHQLFAVSSDLPAAELYGGMQSVGVVGPSGDAWFATTQGALHIMPDAAPGNHGGIPLVVEQVLVDGVATDFSKGLTVPPGIRTIEITYSGIVLQSQAGLRFRRQLVGFDKGWSLPTTERIATYTNLPAGHYTFQIEALFDGPAIASLSLPVQQNARFYHRGWFLTLCVVLVLLTAWLVHWFRLHQMRMRFRAIMHERNRLAREMHDTVIQGCTGISAVLEAISSLGENRGEGRKLLNYAREQVVTTITEAREAVWNLRRTAMSEDSLTAALKTMLDHLVEGTGVQTQTALDSGGRMLDGDVVHELLMAAREAIHNALTHGAPSVIRLHLISEDHHLLLRIEDDGRGFVVTAPSAQRDAKGVVHYGLLGIRERMDRAHGTFELQSTTGTGTRVTLRVPIQLPRSTTAYALEAETL